MEGAEAKAYYGLAVNYRALEALVERLLVKETLSGNEVPPCIRAPQPSLAKTYFPCAQEWHHSASTHVDCAVLEARNSIQHVAEHILGKPAHVTAPWMTVGNGLALQLAGGLAW